MRIENADLKARLGIQQGPPPQSGGPAPQQGGYPPPQGGYPPQQGGPPPQQQQPGWGRPKLMGMKVVKELGTEVHEKFVRCLHVSQDNILWTSAQDGVKALDSNHKVVATLPVEGCWSPSVIGSNSSFIVTCIDSGYMTIWNKFNNSKMRDLKLSDYTCNHMVVTEAFAFTANGDQFQAIDLETLQVAKKMTLSGGIACVAYAPTKNWVLVTLIDDIFMYDVATWEQVKKINYGSIRQGKSMAIQGDTIYLGTSMGKIVAFDLNTGTQLFVLEGHNSEVTAMAIKYNTLFTTSTDKTIKIWDLTKKGFVNSIPIQEPGVDLTFWGEQMVTLQATHPVNTIKLWE